MAWRLGMDLLRSRIGLDLIIPIMWFWILDKGISRRKLSRDWFRGNLVSTPAAPQEESCYTEGSHY